PLRAAVSPPLRRRRPRAHGSRDADAALACAPRRAPHTRGARRGAGRALRRRARRRAVRAPRGGRGAARRAAPAGGARGGGRRCCRPAERRGPPRAGGAHPGGRTGGPRVPRRGTLRDGRAGRRAVAAPPRPGIALPAGPCIGRAETMRDRRLFVAAGLGALLTVAVYWNSLSNGLVHDDVSAIERNEAVRDPTDLRTIFLTPSWKARGDLTTISYRPLSTWTLAVDYAFHGTKPFGYHIGNVIGHAAVTILLVVLARATGLSITSAGLAGLLFAVHPVHTEVVANGVGRAEVLAAALALLALLLGRRAAWRGWDLPASLAAASAYGVALLAKEHTVALLLMLPLGDLLLTDGGSLRRFAAGLTGRRKLFYAALGAITAGYLALRATALGGVVGAEGHGFQAILYWANPAASAPLTARILTALRVLAMAVGLLIWPHPLSADYSYRQIPLIDSALAPGALLGIGVAATLTILVAVLWRHGPVACFWLVLALATYAVVSNVFFPIGTIFGERLLYLPSAGFCVLAALAFG